VGTTQVIGIFTDGTATFTVTATSNATLGATPAQLSGVQVFANNNSSGTDVVNLVIAVSDKNFTVPTGPVTLTSSFSGSSTAGAVSGGGTFVSVVDLNNNVFGGLPIGGVPSGNTFSTALQPLTIAPSFQGTVSKGGTTPGAFALSDEFAIPTLALVGGSTLNLTGTTTLGTAIPEPASLIEFTLGLTGLSLGTWLHRRKVKVKVVA
jgi:hypothetical protein